MKPLGSYLLTSALFIDIIPPAPSLWRLNSTDRNVQIYNVIGVPQNGTITKKITLALLSINSIVTPNSNGASKI